MQIILTDQDGIAGMVIAADSIHVERDTLGQINVTLCAEGKTGVRLSGVNEDQCFVIEADEPECQVGEAVDGRPITEYIQTPPDTLRDRALTLLSRDAVAGGRITDEEITAIGGIIAREWETGTVYAPGDVVRLFAQLYAVLQPVTAQAHQAPGSAGMLAIYRPISAGGAEEGTKDNPIPFVLGMDVHTGKYYAYLGNVYLAKADLIPCVWPPDTPGLWQWEKQ